MSEYKAVPVDVSEIPDDRAHDAPKVLDGALTELLLALAVLTVPLLILCAVLLYFVFHFRITEQAAHVLLEDQSLSEKGVFLVNFSATKLLSVASWISSISSLLPGFVMTLISFVVSRQMADASSSGQRSKLMTPYQLSIVIGTISGSVGILLDWIFYQFRGKKREATTAGFKLAVWGFISAFALGFAIVGADTWLHTATSSIVMYPKTREQPTSFASYGRDFNASAKCWNAEGLPCTITSGSAGIGLLGGPVAFRTLANISEDHVVLHGEHEAKPFAFITAPKIPQLMYFEASTVAVNTDCKLITRDCKLRVEASGSTPYSCSSGFSGDLTSYADTQSRRGPFVSGLQFFQDSDLKTNFTKKRNTSDEWAWQNPLYAGAFNLVPGLVDETISEDVIATKTQALAFILNCKMSAYHMRYASFNGSISLLEPLSLANDSVMGVLTGPFTARIVDINAIAQTAASQDNGTALESTYASLLSSTALAMSAGVMVAKPNLAQEMHEQNLVARVPKAPLYLLVGLSLVYVHAGLALAILAFGAGPRRVRYVQGRINIIGLMAALFGNKESEVIGVEKLEDLFDEFSAPRGESGKVAVRRTEGGGASLTLI